MNTHFDYHIGLNLHLGEELPELFKKTTGAFENEIVGWLDYICDLALILILQFSEKLNDMLEGLWDILYIWTVSKVKLHCSVSEFVIGYFF